MNTFCARRRKRTFMRHQLSLLLALALAFCETSLYGWQDRPQPVPPEATPAATPLDSAAIPAPPPVRVTEPLTMKAGTPMCLFPKESISSKTAKVNTRVSFSVGKDVSVDGVTIIPADTAVWAAVTEVKKQEIGGKDAILTFTFEPVPLATGTTVPVRPFRMPRGTPIQPPKEKKSAGKVIKDVLEDPYSIWWPIAVPFMVLIPFEKGHEATLSQYQCVPEETALDVVLDKEDVVHLPRAPIPRIQEELIAETKGGIAGAWIEPRTNRLVWIEERPERKRALWLDGKQVGEEYDEVSDVALSKDGQQSAFAARRGSKWMLVVNGKEGAPEFDAVAGPDIANDGRFAAPVRTNGKWRLMTNNGEVPGLEFQQSKWSAELPISRVTFDDSGTHYALIAHRRGRWITVMDGKEIGVEMDRIRQTLERSSITPTGTRWLKQHFVLAAEIDGKWSWVIDGQPGPAFDAIGAFQTTPDGAHYAYAGARYSPGQSSGSVILDGNPIASYTGAGIEKRAGRDLFFGVGPLRPSLQGVSDPILLGDGTVVYAGRRAAQDVVVISKGAPGPSFDDVSDIHVTPDGEHIVYLGTRGSSDMDVRDQNINLPLRPAAALLQMSDDGSHMAYLTGTFEPDKSLTGLTATKRVIVDGKSDPEFQLSNWSHDGLGFQFSMDGRHYLYEVHTFRQTRCFMSNNCAGERQSLLVIDGAQADSYDDVLPGAEWVERHTLRFIARRGKQWLRVNYNLGD
jgi:hypothetical protein